MTTALALVLLLTMARPEPCPTELGTAIEYVESRGQTLAVSRTGARGLWQVQPRWSRVPAFLLHVPSVGRWEGCRILNRWLHRARSRCEWERRRGRKCDPLRRGLAAYNAGGPGLRGSSSDGRRYVAAVLARLQKRTNKCQ